MNHAVMSAPLVISEIPPGLSTDKTVWLADLTHTQAQVAAELIPYAVGGISTFMESRISFSSRIRLFKYPEALAEALDRDGPPDMIGFSNYCWNGSLSSAFARRVKEIRPDTIVVFGGPNYPVADDEQAAYLRAHPEVDFHIYKEGELPLTQLVAVMIQHGWSKAAAEGKVPSAHSILADGTPYLDKSMPRIKDLSCIPSPYLDGRLDEFFDGTLLPIIQFRRGCPFSCTFCTEGELYFNKIHSNTVDKSEAELDYITRKMVEIKSKGGRFDLFIADSNFGMYKEDVAIAKKIAAMRGQFNYPDYVHVATGKNQKARVLEVANTLGGALRLSGSVQSLDPTTLKNIKRANINADDLLELAKRAAEADANSYSELILGLPGETKESHYNSLRTVMDAGFTRIVVYQLWILPGTEMGSRSTQQQYDMDLRYRVQTRCFGKYDIAGKETIVAEIDQACVATNTLSFEDYLECRQMHFMINMFYNDAVFSSVLKFLKAINVSCFRWMELLNQAKPQGGLLEILEEFRQAMRDELWDSREELESFIQQPGIFERYLGGDLGFHLMFTAKAKAMIQSPLELSDLAERTVRQLLAESGKDTAENLSFLRDALAYDISCMTGIWQDRDQDIIVPLQYDIGRFLVDSNSGQLSRYKFPTRIDVRFILDDKQRESIERNLAVWGDDIQGIVRILSKAFIKKFLRQPQALDLAS